MWCLHWCVWSNRRVLPSQRPVGSVSPGRETAVSLFHSLFSLSLCRFSLNAIYHDRVFLALVERQEDRGTVVAQGGGKVEHHEF